MRCYTESIIDSNIRNFSRRVVELILKCNNLTDPGFVLGDLTFTVGVSDGYAEKLEFTVSDGENVVYENVLSGGKVSPLKLSGGLFTPDNEYLWTVKGYVAGKLAAVKSLVIKTGFLPENAKWVTIGKSLKNVLRFERGFEIPVATPDEIKNAKLFICGLGFFDSYLNGTKTDDSYFKPLFSDYRQRDRLKNPSIPLTDKHSVGAIVYDVKNLIKPGENVLSVTVGNGYFKNEDKIEEPYVSFGGRRLIYELRIALKNGKTLRVFSDGTENVYETPVRSDLFFGDKIDFRAEEKFISSAKICDEKMGEWQFYSAACDRVAEILAPIKSPEKTANGLLYDFGKNHTGGLRFKIRGRRGQKITLRYAEKLFDDGSLNTLTSDWSDYNVEKREKVTIEQTAEYVLSGNTDEISPLFCWRCYRYVEIRGADGAEISDLSSLFIHSDIAFDCEFRCSNELFNRIYDATVLTFKDNLHSGVISDCPHREKRPYTGDAGIVEKAMLVTADAVGLYEKFLDDVLSVQRADGFVGYSAPYMGGGGGYAWSVAVATVPDALYSFTGNVSYVEKTYPAIKKWINYCKNKSRNYIVEGNGEKWLLGDWLAPEITVFDVRLMNSLCFYESVKTAERFAAILKKDDEEKEFASLLKRIKDAINAEFLNSDDCNYAAGVQGENVYPLFLGVLPDNLREKMLGKIRDFYVSERKFHIDTGFVATPALLDALAKNGMADIAYKILDCKDYPSYASMLEGETTLCEHWSKKWPDYKTGSDGRVVKGGGELSHCHPMFGSVAEILFKYAAGIDLFSLSENKIVIRPEFAPYLDFAEAKKTTAYGEVKISLKKDGKKLKARFNVPSGLFAEFYPSGICGGLKINGNAASVETDENGNVLPLTLPCGEYEAEYVLK